MVDRANLEDIKFLESVAPYISEFAGKTFVLKMGGEVIGETLDPLAHEIAILYKIGIKIIVVHGGGTQISDYSREIGIKPKKVHGLRVTDKETLEQAVKPIMRKLNLDVKGALDKYDVDAISLQIGEKPELITAVRAPPIMVDTGGRRRKSVDLGFVGEVEDVNTATLDYLLNEGYIPVISSLGMDSRGTIYNINADKVAGGIAERVGADKLVILTDVRGVYRHPTKRQHGFVSYMDTEEGKSLIKKGKVTKGMIPKLETCIHAIENGVPRTHIVKGIDPYTLIEEVLGPGTGTMIVSPQEIRRYEREMMRNK